MGLRRKDWILLIVVLTISEGAILGGYLYASENIWWSYERRLNIWDGLSDHQKLVREHETGSGRPRDPNEQVPFLIAFPIIGVIVVVVDRVTKDWSAPVKQPVKRRRGKRA